MQYLHRRLLLPSLLLALGLFIAGCGGDGSSSPGEVADCVAGGATDLETLGCPDPFVDAHNQWRQDLNAGNLPGQPIPSPEIANVSWDPTLAEVAADWAARCDWGHNDGRTDDYVDLGGSEGYVGENIYARWGSAPTAADALDSWAGGEYPHYDYNTNSCAANEVCGHYTQVVWDDSLEIGCGTALCPEMRIGGEVRDDVWFIVCNYAPGGNYNGETPY